jgi:hypothetical protein
MSDTEENDKLIDDAANSDNNNDDVKDPIDEVVFDQNLKLDWIESDAPKFGPWPWLDNIVGDKHAHRCGPNGCEKGYTFDKSTVEILGPGWVMFNVIVVASGLLKLDCVALKLLWCIGNITWIYLILNRRTEKVQHIATEASSMFHAADRSIVLLSIFSIFAVLSKIDHDKPNMILIGSILMSAAMGSFWYTFEDEPLNYRDSRNVAVAGINLSIMLFVLLVAKIYFCAGGNIGAIII